jgi:hypothetical protein
MRKRFELQLSIGQTPIGDIYINPKSKNALDQLIAALKELYCDNEYNEMIFSIIEKYLPKLDKNNGRPGMNLWTIFVLAQVRLCLGLDYDMLHNLSNNHSLLRKLIGISEVFGEESFIFEYQNIYDNVSKLSDAMLKEINDVIVAFGQREVFKKKESTALRLKTDSFVVESNVHFPSDYSLLWDCARKCLDVVNYFRKQYPGMDGWRKTGNWYWELKSMERQVGRISRGGGKNKQEKLQKVVQNYLSKSRLLHSKLVKAQWNFPLTTDSDFLMLCDLENYMKLLLKHIDLLERRVIKGEQIPQEEKMMSIFEPYTEWVVKGKTRPWVELGKKVSITSDQYDLILLWKVMDGEQDRNIVIEIADELLSKYKSIESMSFDKGHWNADNRSLLQLEIPTVILPKLGKRTTEETEKEESKLFKRLKNRHSAIESNINELEHRGLDRCPDRGFHHYKAYIALGVCAYNLKKIGKKILENKIKELPIKKVA